jgi:hypothetical protein
MKNVLLYEDWIVNEKSGDLYNPPRGRMIDFDPKKNPELADEFFNLIATAYAEVGGHAKVRSPRDVFSDPDWNFWQGEDIHGTNDFDIIIFGQKTKYGIKFAGVGHDGSGEAKREYINSRAKDLKEIGYYVEVSGKIAAILISKYGVPVVNDQAEVEKVLGKKVEWVGKNPEESAMPGDSWYVRSIGGHNHAKILLGRPRI